METYALICGAWGDIIVSLKELRQSSAKTEMIFVEGMAKQISQNG